MRSGQIRGIRMGVASLLCLAAVWACAAQAFAKPVAYVANNGTDNVSPFDTSSSGLLTLGDLIPVGAGPLGTAGTPNGRFLYVALNDVDKVAAFAVAPDATLSAVPGSPFGTGINPVVPAVSPDGENLYVANFGSDSISAYAIATDGSLTLVGTPATTGDGPMQISISPDGTHLYAPNFGNNNVSAFVIAADGSLSAVAGSPFAAGSFPNNSEISPDGAHLYVSNRLGNSISAYAVAANGSLAPVPGSPFATATNPNGIAIANGGANLYVADTGSNILSRFSVAGTGALTPLGGTTTGVGPVALETGLGDGVLYVTNSTSNSVSSFTIEANGDLAPVAGSPFSTGGSAPSGRSIAVLDTDDQVSFDVKFKRKQKQHGKRIKVRFKLIADEAISARVTGVIAGRGLRQGAKLKRVRTALDSGQSRNFTMKLKKKQAGKGIAKLLGKGKKLKANLTFLVTDDLDNTNIRRVKILLK
jgi:6-phosphogluconolactonase